MRFITLTALCLALSGGVALADPHRGHYGSYGHRGWSAAPARSYHNSGYRSPRYHSGYNRGYRYPSYGYNRGYRYPSYGYNRGYRYSSYGYNPVYPYRPTFGFSIGLATYPSYNDGYDDGYPAYGYATRYEGSGSWVWDGYEWVWQPAVSGYISPDGYDPYRY